MVNTSEEAMSDETPLEWRRHFYGFPNAVLITAGAFCGLQALVFFALVALASHRTFGIILAGGGLMALGTAAMMAIRVQAFSKRANSVRVVDGAVRVELRLSHEPAIGAFISWAGLGVAAIGVLAAVRVGVLSDVHPAAQAVLWAFLALLLAFTVVVLVFQPFARYLEFTPDELRCHLGVARAVIPWSSIVNLRFYRAEMSFWLPGFQDGIAIATTDAARFSGTTFPRRTGAFPVALTAYTVDEDTLYNVITALFEHPELRELLGSEDGEVLFEGPPRSLRVSMRRRHVWLPWERGILARLHDTHGNSNNAHRDGHANADAATAAAAAENTPSA